MNRLYLALPFVAVLALGACSSGDDPDHDQSILSESDGAVVSDDVDANVEADGVFAFPSITSCSELDSIVGDFVGDIPLNEGQSFFDPESIMCEWNRENTDIESLPEIQAFSVYIQLGTDEVITLQEVEDLGMESLGDMYFTTDELDEVGGIGIWIDSDTAAAGAGSGQVLLPGVDISFTDLRWGADNMMQRDDMVNMALQIAQL